MKQWITLVINVNEFKMNDPTPGEYHLSLCLWNILLFNEKNIVKFLRLCLICDESQHSGLQVEVGM